jgi:hypothetical protein
MSKACWMHLKLCVMDGVVVIAFGVSDCVCV